MRASPELVCFCSGRIDSPCPASPASGLVRPLRTFQRTPGLRPPASIALLVGVHIRFAKGMPFSFEPSAKRLHAPTRRVVPSARSVVLCVEGEASPASRYAVNGFKQCVAPTGGDEYTCSLHTLPWTACCFVLVYSILRIFSS
ncbi:hypothetical protein VTO73DRAFT_9342 [Trametes versicolor]